MDADTVKRAVVAQLKSRIPEDVVVEVLDALAAVVYLQVSLMRDVVVPKICRISVRRHSGRALLRLNADKRLRDTLGSAMVPLDSVLPSLAAAPTEGPTGTPDDGTRRPAS